MASWELNLKFEAEGLIDALASVAAFDMTDAMRGKYEGVEYAASLTGEEILVSARDEGAS